jgi:hypothetical protein
MKISTDAAFLKRCGPARRTGAGASDDGRFLPAAWRGGNARPAGKAAQAVDAMPASRPVVVRVWFRARGGDADRLVNRSRPARRIRSRGDDRAARSVAAKTDALRAVGSRTATGVRAFQLSVAHAPPMFPPREEARRKGGFSARPRAGRILPFGQPAERRRSIPR